MQIDLIERIKNEVSIYDLCDESGIKYLSRDKQHQISCPFHGKDRNASARIYPESNSIHCFYCGESWDVISFWARANEWYVEEGTSSKPDIGKAINDLARKYKLFDKKPDWKSSLDKTLKSLSVQQLGYKGVSSKERQKLKNFYAWRISQKIKKITKEDRSKNWEEIRNLWDSLDTLDLHSSTWKKDLSEWNKTTTVAESREETENESPD